MKKILILGASGLVGSNLVPHLRNKNEIHVAGRRPPAIEQVKFYPLDLAQPFDADGLPTRIDAVIYLAQSDRFREFPDQASQIFDVNVAALVHVLDWARRAGAQSFVLASSGGIYGSPEAPVTEAASIAANGQLGFYLTTKLCGEMLAENYAGLMNMVILRLFFAYGRGQRRSMLIPRLVDQIRAGQTVQLRGQQGISINPVHAADAAAACGAALDLQGFHRINVAGPETISLRTLSEMIGRLVGREPVFDVRPGYEGQLIADTRQMAAKLIPPRRRLQDHLSELL